MKPDSLVDRRQCVTCGAELPRYSKAEKCRACHLTAVKANGLASGRCLDCGKTLRNPASARCRTCWAAGTRRSNWEARADDWLPRGPLVVLPSETTVAERAYAAGMVDGEGHIALAPWKGSFLPIVEVINTDTRATDWFSEHFPGGNVVKYDRQNQRHKPRYNWRLTGRRAYAFLREIDPYLVFKHEQAALIFAYYDEGGYFQHGAERLPAEEIIRRAELHLKSKALNARGP